MASTSPNNDGVLMENPSNGNTLKVPDQRYRHCQQGNQRCAPPLQEKVYRQDDEHQRFDQCVTLGDRQCRIERGGVIQSRWKVFLNFYINSTAPCAVATAFVLGK
jgi:hypothetical protein